MDNWWILAIIGGIVLVFLLALWIVSFFSPKAKELLYDVEEFAKKEAPKVLWVMEELLLKSKPELQALCNELNLLWKTTDNKTTLANKIMENQDANN
jgi:hypothetical protein